MTSRNELPVKLYYRIGEVAEVVGVEPHVLRYWESEFGSIRPQKSPKGQRVYSRRDLEKLLRVRELLYEQGYTIAGAKKRMREAASSKLEPSTEAPPSASAAPEAVAPVAVAATVAPVAAAPAPAGPVSVASAVAPALASAAPANVAAASAAPAASGEPYLLEMRTRELESVRLRSSRFERELLGLRDLLRGELHRLDRAEQFFDVDGQA